MQPGDVKRNTADQPLGSARPIGTVGARPASTTANRSANTATSKSINIAGARDINNAVAGVTGATQARTTYVASTKPVMPTPTVNKAMSLENLATDISSSSNSGNNGVAPASTPSNSPSVVMSAKGGRKTGWVLALIFFFLLAAGGVGFGVWTMMDGNEKINRLNEENNELKEQNAQLLEATNTTDETNETESSVDSNKYIVMGEWDFKIEIPDTLNYVEYVVESWDEESFAGTSLCVTGATVGHGDVMPSFVKPGAIKNGLTVCLNKNTKSLSEEEGGEGFETIPEGEFYIQTPQALTGDGTDEEWEAESLEALTQLLENPENRSAI